MRTPGKAPHQEVRPRIQHHRTEAQHVQYSVLFPLPSKHSFSLPHLWGPTIFRPIRENYVKSDLEFPEHLQEFGNFGSVHSGIRIRRMFFRIHAKIRRDHFLEIDPLFVVCIHNLQPLFSLSPDCRINSPPPPKMFRLSCAEPSEEGGVFQRNGIEIMD
jgi:hypothetical protein